MWVLNLKFLFKFSSRAQLHKKFATETRSNDQAIKYYAKIIRALTKLLKSNKQDKQKCFFVFNKNAILAFRKLITIFTQISMLIYFNSKNYICLKTNISRFAIAIILLQLVYFIKKAD